MMFIRSCWVQRIHFAADHNHFMGSVCLESLDNCLANTASSSDDSNDDHDVCSDFGLCLGDDVEPERFGRAVHVVGFRECWNERG